MTRPSAKAPLFVLIALLTVGAVPLLSSASNEVVLVDHGSTWQYRVDAHGACPGFESLGYAGPCTFSSGAAPFGNMPGFCNGIYPDPATGWPANTDLLAYIDLIVPVGSGALHFDYDVDNNIQVFVDGSPVYAATHGFCLEHGAFDLAVPSGIHKLAVRAIDLGGATYFRMRVTASLTCPLLADDVVVCVTPGPVSQVVAVPGVVDGMTYHVAGYIDAYRFALPTGGSVTVPCVTLTTGIVTGSQHPCAVAGGEFVSRTTLVDTTGALPQPGDPPLATVSICDATLTATVLGFGVTQPIYTVC